MLIRTPHELGAAARGRRQRLKLTQARIAQSAGVSRVWLSEFETGKSTVELGNVFAVLQVLDFRFELLAPDEVADMRTTDESDPGPTLDEILGQYNQGDA